MKNNFVAPHAGARIETVFRLLCGSLLLSLPMRERGLKPHKFEDVSQMERSLPMRERGLKLIGGRHTNRWCWSLPMRERGLKHESAV